MVDQYDVEFTVNEKFSEKNNLHSLSLIADKISNTYIIPSDLRCSQNPFRKKELYSWYMVSDLVDNDSDVRVNRKMKLIKIPKNSGENSMIGIAYIVGEESEILKRNLNLLSSNGNQMTENEYIDFCMKVAYPINHDMENSDVWNEVMRIFNSNNRTIREFLSYYIFFVNCQNDNQADSNRYTKEQLINLVCNCLKDTHIPYELKKEENDCFIFPKGAEELDNALVSDVLIWLEEYPLSHKAFVKALKEYSKLTDDNISTVADLLRKALETHLQSYTNFNNSYAKHNDKSSKDTLEYIMYQTGSLIRFKITLKDKDDEE